MVIMEMDVCSMSLTIISKDYLILSWNISTTKVFFS
jgi:hypothetical protein